MTARAWILALVLVGAAVCLVLRLALSGPTSVSSSGGHPAAEHVAEQASPDAALPKNGAGMSDVALAEGGFRSTPEAQAVLQEMMKREAESLSRDMPEQNRRVKWEDERVAYPAHRIEDVPGGGLASEFVSRRLREILAESERVKALRKPEKDPRTGKYSGACDPEAGSNLARLQDEVSELALGNAQAFDALIQAASSREAGASDLALTLLGRLPLQKAVEYLISVSRSDADPKRRALAVQSLGQDQGWNVRYADLKNWSIPEASYGPVTDTLALTELMRAAEKDPDDDVRMWAVRILKFSQGSPEHPAKDTKQFRIVPIPTFSAVTETLKRVASADSNSQVRATAFDSLDSSTDPQTLDFLRNCALTASSADDRSSALFRVMGMLQDNSQKFDLAKRAFLEDPSETVRAAAVQSLRFSPPTPAVTELFETAMVRDPSYTVRFSAFTAALNQDRSSALHAVEVLKTAFLRGRSEDTDSYDQYLWSDEFWERRLRRASDAALAREQLENLRQLHPKRTTQQR